MNIYRRTILVAAGAGMAAEILGGCDSQPRENGAQSSTVPQPPSNPNVPGKAECQFDTDETLRLQEAARVFPGAVAVAEAVILRPILEIDERGVVTGIRRAKSLNEDGSVQLQTIPSTRDLKWRISPNVPITPPLEMKQNDGCEDLGLERRVKLWSQAVTLERGFEHEGIVVPVFKAETNKADISSKPWWDLGAYGVYVSLHTEAAKHIPEALADFTHEALAR